jgi:hypothetical protein
MLGNYWAFLRTSKSSSNSTAKDKPVKESAENDAGKRGKGKRKGSGSNDIRVPKKARVEKSCALCQKHGGAHTTHNTSECRKFEKDGTLQKGFGAKAAVGQKRHSGGKKESCNSFAQVMERFSKLEKAVK